MTSYTSWRTNTGGTGHTFGMSGGGHSDGPRAKCDQVIYEAIAKACEIIVASRGSHTPSPTTSTGHGNGHHAASGNAPSGSSQASRFNLQVAEIPGVRSILQGYRLTLHVPLRLDVYVQHEANRRELLERWCLEYKIASTERFIQVEGIVTQDPLAQLRHVCKRIVLWLRTLYCWTRLLPAVHGRQLNVGFSIYANSNGADDVTELQQQGFRWQAQPSTVVSPYGELVWQVLYSPAIPDGPRKPVRITPSMPIPQSSLSPTRPQSIPPKMTNPDATVPQSAPAKLNRREYMPSPSPPRPTLLDSPRMVAQQHTFDARRFIHPRNREDPATAYHKPHHLMLQRRHTSVEDDRSQERVMSGLSLALMANDQDDDEGPEKDDGTGGLPLSSGLNESSLITNEKRHAALHEIPPHLVEQQTNSIPQRVAPASGAYGYAYNHHIPWQKIHPSNNTPISEDHHFNQRTLSASPSILACTPPAGAFLGATPPSTAATFLPPRSMVTPPFATRPVGFVQEPTVAQFLPPTATIGSSTVGSGLPHGYNPSQTEDVEVKSNLPPVSLASLDMLRCSPFQHPQASVLLGTESVMGLSELRRSAWSSILHHSTPCEEYEDMPFAVDIVDSSTSTSMANPETVSGNCGANTISSLGTSQLSQFAQKFSTHNRLLAFEKSKNSNRDHPVDANLGAGAGTTDHSDDNNSNGDGHDHHRVDLVNDLVDQLAEFRAFGAQLQESESTSTSTPISLRS